MAHELRLRIRQTITQSQLFPLQARLVVAVSGGADSVALLHLLAETLPAPRKTLHIAHLDHGLRDDSAADAAFVERLSKRLGIAATIARWPIAERCAAQGWSLEDGARRLRYDFLLEVAERRAAEYLATAHTADDQAETVLMRILRGTGLTGLGAIPQRRRAGQATIVRPLLGIWRRELLEYLRSRRLTYREDATNRDARFLRNRIRHELLPLLERRYNPNVRAGLAQLAEQSRTDDTCLRGVAERQWKRVARHTREGAVVIRVSAFRRQPAAIQRQLVRGTVESVRGTLQQFEFRHWQAVQRLFTDEPVGSRVSLPGGVEWERHVDHVVCRQRVAAEACSPVR